ncbi:MAG: bifunctional tRNA (5-methylaminomethyl-2-thiouridine)(34)-methyltransferase MnmD/FAD-dependent 5-carboxymethylaminomethyl-2-thiouridine(34) oxidoreductase MnmC [Pseudomonadota bacterium]
MTRLPPAPDVYWDEAGALVSRAFGDVYFSRDGGLEETRAVFLAGCALPERWAARARFAIGELGFGCGLNALATWDAWARTRAPGAVLHFVSVEQFPLTRADAARALGAFPEVALRAENLLAAWPVRAAGAQRLWFPEDGFALTLLHGEAESALAGLTGKFDAWFLDGFAPARNLALWTPALMQQLAAHSAPGARAATYSVAASARASLEGAGFAAEKRPGFGKKKERLEAYLKAEPQQRFPLYPYAPVAAPKVAIVGAGIAGAALAAAFARRGVGVDVYDRAGAHQGASGAPAALMMPRLERTDTPLARLHMAAYLFAQREYAALGQGAFAPIGVEQFPSQDRDPETFAALAADPPLPADWLEASAEKLLHPKAGVVTPAAVIDAWLGGARLHLTEIAAVEREGETWILRDAEGRAAGEAQAVILACGPGLARFAQAQFLPLRYSRGQIDWAPVRGETLARALTAGAYAAPFADGVIFGSTFDRVDAAIIVSPSAESTEDNLAALEELAPDIAARLDRARIQSRAAVRVSTPDVAPVAGMLPDDLPWRARFEALRHGGRVDLSLPAPAHEGLYVLGALGARGFLLAPLLAERIASEICGEPCPLNREAMEAAHPARFLERALRRGA